MTKKMETLKEFYDSGKYLGCGSVLILDDKSTKEQFPCMICRIGYNKIMLISFMGNRWSNMQGNYKSMSELTYDEIMGLFPDYTTRFYNILVPTKYTFDFSLETKK